MATIALASAKGSPGVTTTALALALAWPRRVLLAECDPAGGDVLAGYLRGDVLADRGLLGWAMACRRGPAEQTLWEQLMPLDEAGRVLLLAGLADPAQVAAVARQWPTIASTFAGLAAADPPTDVIVDCGRLGTSGGPGQLLATADQVLLVLRPTLRSAHAAARRLEVLAQAVNEVSATTSQLGLVLIGEGPFGADEVAKALATPVVAALPKDNGAAAALAGEKGRLDRSALIRSARYLADQLGGRIEQRTQLLAGGGGGGGGHGGAAAPTPRKWRQPASR